MEKFKELYEVGAKLLNEAPSIEDCSDEENDTYAELKNLMETLEINFSFGGK